MPYEITITRKETVECNKRGDYTVVDRRPWTQKELSESSGYGNTDAFLKTNPLKEVRDYAPDWRGYETKTTEVLKQTVDELDLAAVIKAVNGL